MAGSSGSQGGLEALSGCGEDSGWVEARTSCPHLDRVCNAPLLPRFDAPCAICGDHRENWVCLSCRKVLCGRFINGHMLSHFQEFGHPSALSYRDLSVWCFACDSYLDAQVISELRPAFDAAHAMKFGTPAPLRC
ncbi:histone deacetylase 6 [Selaginella moellendorffii]|uniref:histone deacetylase 6 n=1 Tax=Selaginella moellendorffii TaxID=88036 RepID=UPI000D1C8323|nr:histone deacetylase 6 [Selaginella moellendorffii]|eukprot:XP_002968200.2 histone deacetylase 6 [Selaginella moellendorffii]